MAKAKTQTRTRKRTVKSGVTYYAWSNIRFPDSTEKAGFRVIRPGEEVTLKTFGEDEFNNLLRNGSIRESPYPEGLRMGQSPTMYRKAEIFRLQREVEEGYGEDESAEDADTDNDDTNEDEEDEDNEENEDE